MPNSVQNQSGLYGHYGQTQIGRILTKWVFARIRPIGVQIICCLSSCQRPALGGGHACLVHTLLVEREVAAGTVDVHLDALAILIELEEFLGYAILVVAVTNSPKHDFNRCKSATCRFLFRDTKSARDKNGTKPRKNKVKDTSPEISLVEYLCFVCKGTNLSLEKRGEIPISLIHNSFSYHCTPNVVIANGFDLKQHDLRKSGVKFCFAL